MTFLQTALNAETGVPRHARLGAPWLLAWLALGCAGGGGEHAPGAPSLLLAEPTPAEDGPLDAADPAGAEDARGVAGEGAPRDGRADEAPEYPWAAGECDSVHVLRVHGGVDAAKPYTVQPEIPVSPQFLFDAPWTGDFVKAVAFHPLIDNEAVIKDWYLYDAHNGTQLAGWQRGRAFAPWPRDDRAELPRGPRSLRLDVHYHNKASAPATDRSGVAICVKAAFGTDAAR